ncbi:MAG: hypothetical protein FWE87_00260 [Coriobacteriia bacterium]|nr:hypothetical protein [Coriobacteriia bacterium]
MALTNDDFMKFLAAWQLVHETADEGLKAAIARGEEQSTGEMSMGPGAFVDGLAAQVEVLKEELKDELSNPEVTPEEADQDLTERVERLSFEVGALRGQLESMNATLDALAARTL